MKLRYAIENQRGATLLAGPAGTGKTMLARLLEAQLDARFAPFVRLVFPQMSSRDLLVYLAEELGAPPADPPRHTVEESVRRLEFYLAQNAHLDRHAVVVVDEAHLLEDCGALETLRLLLNFELDAKPTFSLLLVGQMGLVSAVGRLPSLAERVAVSAWCGRCRPRRPPHTSGIACKRPAPRTHLYARRSRSAPLPRPRHSATNQSAGRSRTVGRLRRPSRRAHRRANRGRERGAGGDQRRLTGSRRQTKRAIAHPASQLGSGTAEAPPATSVWPKCDFQ